MTTVILALTAAVAYGAADFLGGLASRRFAAASVVVTSQVAGVCLLAAVYPFIGGRFYAVDLLWGGLAGICGAVGIAALYAGLAVGRMGLVSPVTAVVGAALPVAWGLTAGERPGAPALAGLALAFVAVGLVSSSGGRPSLREPGLAAALLSGTSIGFLYIMLAHGHRDSGLEILAASRATSIPLLTAYALTMRQPLRPPRGLWATIAWAGLLDMGANVLYVLAARSGMLAIAAVLTSLYPASTVVLARVRLHERLTATQWWGAALAGAGVTLIALGR